MGTKLECEVDVEGSVDIGSMEKRGIAGDERMIQRGW
jgi:hypothetical protein